MNSEETKIDRYFVRTVEHIHRVQNNMLTLVTRHWKMLGLTDDQRRQAMFNVMAHDATKFSPEQFSHYVELTEYHRQKRSGNLDYEYAPGVAARVQDAIQDHYVRENHHPERLEGQLGKYDQLEALETACDLQAMAQEFDEGSCREYYEKHWKPSHCKYFYDDYNWACVQAWMSGAIECFEADVAAHRENQTSLKQDAERENYDRENCKNF